MLISFVSDEAIGDMEVIRGFFGEGERNMAAVPEGRIAPTLNWKIVDTS